MWIALHQCTCLLNVLYCTYENKIWTQTNILCPLIPTSMLFVFVFPTFNPAPWISTFTSSTINNFPLKEWPWPKKETRQSIRRTLCFDYENYNSGSACSTPFVSAPSSPGRGPLPGYFFSAPSSPMHHFLLVLRRCSVGQSEARFVFFFRWLWVTVKPWSCQSFDLLKRSIGRDGQVCWRSYMLQIRGDTNDWRD